MTTIGTTHLNTNKFESRSFFCLTLVPLYKIEVKDSYFIHFSFFGPPGHRLYMQAKSIGICLVVRFFFK